MAQFETTRTEFGASLRLLAVLVDEAPALKGAMKHPDIPVQIPVNLSTPLAVQSIARDFMSVVEIRTMDDGRVNTSTTISVGMVDLHLFSLTDPETVLRRPTAATAQIEERIDWGITPPSVEVGDAA